MQHKLLTLLFCVVFSVAVHGFAQIRLMNAQFDPARTISVTSVPNTNNTEMAVQGEYNLPYLAFPSSPYFSLPNPFFPTLNGVWREARAYDVNRPTGEYLALGNFTLEDNQRYSAVFVGASSSQLVESTLSTSYVYDQLFLFEEVGPSPGPWLKIVNVAVASTPTGHMIVTVDRYGDFYVPYGQDTDFFLPNGDENLDITARFGNETYTFNMHISSVSTVVYIRGDIGQNYTRMGHTISEAYYYDYADSPAPVAESPFVAPTSEPQTGPMIRFINGYVPYEDYFFIVAPLHGGFVQNVTVNTIGSYLTLQGSRDYYVAVSSYYGVTSSQDTWLESGRYYTAVLYEYGLMIIPDAPLDFNRTNSHLQIVNTVPGRTYIQLYTSAQGYIYNADAGNGFYSDFMDYPSGYAQIEATAEGYNTTYTSFYLRPDLATTVYILGPPSSVSFYVSEISLPGPSQPICVNGYLESTGVCNCYSGYVTASSTYLCAWGGDSYCYQNQDDDLSNDFVPYITDWRKEVYGNQLTFTVLSPMVMGRRTLIEMPNPQCSFVNSPQYYQKYNDGCQDRYDVNNIPFTECGFVKTSTSSEDVYKGTVNVKQIDRVTVAGSTYDRVINTPMPIAIRLPKTLAVQSYVQVFGPPSLAIDAAFVGQTVSTESQSGNLQYVSAVQYPLAIEAVQLVDLPWGVDAWIEVINVNCSGVGPCVQRLEIHLNTTSCSISGVYRMVVSLTCRSQQGCPEEAKNGTQVFIESRIVSQSLCGELAVDIDLNGYIQAYTDQSFSNSALAFYPGQSAYFLINAFSSRVSLSKVSVESVYYYGPNIGFQYLSYNGTLTNIAVANNYTTGSVGSSQAWFGLDISVSTPNSVSNSSLFKLYQGQNGVYNFVAVVDVEWFVTDMTPVQPPRPSPVAAPTSAPVDSPTVAPLEESVPVVAPFKKRMILQGSVSNQGSQFTAQVQVAGPTPTAQQPPQEQQQTPPVTESKPGNDPVSSSVSLSSSLLVAFVALLTLF